MRVLAPLIIAIGLTSCTMSTVAPLPYDDENGVDNEGIRQTVLDNRASSLSCYNESLKDTPTLTGKVTMVWKMDKDGKVTESNVKENTTGSQSFATCLTEASKKWAFPKLPKSDTLTVIYPLAFSRNIK